MVKAFSYFRNSVVLGVASSTPSARHIFFSNGMHFQVTSLLLIMCMLFTIKVIISFPIIVTIMLVCVPLALYYIILQLDLCAAAIINILHHYRELRVVCLPATECQRVVKQHG